MGIKLILLPGETVWNHWTVVACFYVSFDVSFTKVLKRSFLDVFHLIYPRECPGCDRLLSDKEYDICFGCMTDIEKTGFENKPKDNDLYLRFAGKVPLDGAGALYFFDKLGKMRKIISALKYQNSPQVGRLLGQVYGQRLKESGFAEGIEKIVPVPLHWTRLRSRGYNQAAEFAKGLSQEMGVRVDESILKRRGKTSTQTRKSKLERWDNVKSVFKVVNPTEAGILLVDDVITTGATLEACIRVLQAEEVKPEVLKVAAIGVTRHD